jgi:hypothetical protein
MKRWAWCGSLIVGLVVSTAEAHIGSPTVFFEGMAGPYPVRVVIRPPQAVPGRAAISVRLPSEGVQRVTVLPVRWDAGRKGAPPPDEAKPVRGESDLFSAELWLMDRGAYSVFVEVEGRLGRGEAIVPVNSLATERLSMPPWFGSVLVVLGVLLYLGMITIAGAAVGESVLAPGETASRKRRWGAWAARAGMALLVAALVYGGKNWWDKVERHHRTNRLFRPIRMDARVRDEGPNHSLQLTIPDPQWDTRDRRPLVADHGKLMHLFLMREPALDAFAHLHPMRKDGKTFETGLPPLPQGRYRVFADVTHESGFSQTLIASVTIPEGGAEDREVRLTGGLDPDDSWLIAPPAPGGDGSALTNYVSGDLMMIWERPAEILAARDAGLRFRLLHADGRPAPLEAYLGMMAHAVVCHEDGSVFTHLHPLGTISMASQQLFARREKAGNSNERPGETFCGPQGNEISFPYEFPKPGHYRVWVQTKFKGIIVTGAFDARVQPAP